MIFGSWPGAGESGVLSFFGHLQVPEIGNNLWSLSLIQSRGNLHRFYTAILLQTRQALEKKVGRTCVLGSFNV
jgi:hypothetical protein